jgi:hypothetical protein
MMALRKIDKPPQIVIDQHRYWTERPNWVEGHTFVCNMTMNDTSYMYRDGQWYDGYEPPDYTD